MRFRLVATSVTLNDLERRNSLILRYFTEFGSFRRALRKMVEDVAVEMFTFAISSPDKLLVVLHQRISRIHAYRPTTAVQTKYNQLHCLRLLAKILKQHWTRTSIQIGLHVQVSCKNL